MRGFRAFLTKELLEILRTWRLWVLPGIVLFFAVSGPILALLTPELLKSVTGSQPGLVIELPDPTWRDAYLQWTKNLAQIVTYALVIILGGLVSSERKGGTAVLVLTKPVTRAAFVLAKFVSQVALLAVTTVLGAAVTWLVTLATFGEAPLGVLASSTGAWLAWGVLLVATMTLASTLVNSLAGAAGLGFAALIALSIATLWGPALEYSPAGLMNAPSALVVGDAVALTFPLLTALGLAVALVLAAVRTFTRAEL
jgi:ABC-2 type transport system permease protein